MGFDLRAHVIEAGVWSSSGRLSMIGEGANEWGISVCPAQLGEVGDVDAIDIASLNLPQIGILKIDIEGSEIELFSRGVERWASYREIDCYRAARPRVRECIQVGDGRG